MWFGNLANAVELGEPKPRQAMVELAMRQTIEPRNDIVRGPEHPIDRHEVHKPAQEQHGHRRNREDAACILPRAQDADRWIDRDRDGAITFAARDHRGAAMRPASLEHCTISPCKPARHGIRILARAEAARAHLASVRIRASSMHRPSSSA